MEKIKIFSPATVANVTCAFDIMGFALEAIGDYMSFSKTDEKGVHIKMLNSSTIPEEPERNVAGVVALKMLEYLNADFGIEMEIDKRIKPGSGIGSSAASASGAAFGINQLIGNVFNDLELIKFAMHGEALASGVEHADNAAPALLGGFTLVRSYTPLEVIQLPVPEQLYCTVIHPLFEIKTEEARKILKPQVPMRDAVQQWGNVAGLVSGLFLNDYELIGRSLTDKIVEPVRSALIPLFSELKSGFMKAGALGGGISGSGPSVYAFSKGLENAQRVADAMTDVYSHSSIPFDIHISKVNKKGAIVVE